MSCPCLKLLDPFLSLNLDLDLSCRSFSYLLVLLCLFCFLSLANSIYYKFYASFASLGELATLSQAETVTGAIFEKVKLTDFIYILFPLLFKYVHDKLKEP